MVTNWMKQTYDQFTQRVMTNRKDKIKDIDQVARGRIFLARQAKELGMVDELGGLSDAIKYAAAEAKLTEYDVKPIPGSRSLIDILTGRAGAPDEDATMPYRPNIRVSIDSPLNYMPASARRLLGQQLQIIQLLDKRPIMLVSPYSITVK
jgi:ClpP class serine protease